MLNAMFAIIAICFFAHTCRVVFRVPTEEDSKSEILEEYYTNKYKH